MLIFFSYSSEETHAGSAVMGLEWAAHGGRQGHGSMGATSPPDHKGRSLFNLVPPLLLSCPSPLPLALSALTMAFRKC
jgi:hypothetical protein